MQAHQGRGLLAVGSVDSGAGALRGLLCLFCRGGTRALRRTVPLGRRRHALHRDGHGPLRTAGRDGPKRRHLRSGRERRPDRERRQGPAAGRGRERPPRRSGWGRHARGRPRERPFPRRRRRRRLVGGGWRSLRRPALLWRAEGQRIGRHARRGRARLRAGAPEPRADGPRPHCCEPGGEQPAGNGHRNPLDVRPERRRHAHVQPRAGRGRDRQRRLPDRRRDAPRGPGVRLRGEELVRAPRADERREGRDLRRGPHDRGDRRERRAGGHCPLARHHRREPACGDRRRRALDHRPRRRRHLHVRARRRRRRHRQRRLRDRRVVPSVDPDVQLRGEELLHRARADKRRARRAPRRGPDDHDPECERGADRPRALALHDRGEPAVRDDGGNALDDRPGPRRHVHVLAGRRNRRDGQRLLPDRRLDASFDPGVQLRGEELLLGARPDARRSGRHVLQGARDHGRERERRADGHRALGRDDPGEPARGNDDRHALDDRRRPGRDVHVLARSGHRLDRQRGVPDRRRDASLERDLQLRGEELLRGSDPDERRPRRHARRAFHRHRDQRERLADEHRPLTGDDRREPTGGDHGGDAVHDRSGPRQHLHVHPRRGGRRYGQRRVPARRRDAPLEPGLQLRGQELATPCASRRTTGRPGSSAER